MMLTDEVLESGKGRGRNLRQVALFIFPPFPGCHVENFHVGRGPLLDRRQLPSEFLLPEDSAAAFDQKRAESLKRCHDAGDTRLDVLPEICPNKIAAVNDGEASAGDGDHGGG